MPAVFAASSMFRWVSSAAIASSFLRPNFPPELPFPPNFHQPALARSYAELACFRRRTE